MMYCVSSKITKDFCRHVGDHEKGVSQLTTTCGFDMQVIVMKGKLICCQQYNKDNSIKVRARKSKR